MSAMAAEPKPKQPLEEPELGPKGPRTPYPVDEPIDPKGPGSEPDYFPGKPGSDLPKLRDASARPIHVGRRRRPVSWLQAH
jgi:hypothetical protein